MQHSLSKKGLSGRDRQANACYCEDHLTGVRLYSIWLRAMTLMVDTSKRRRRRQAASRAPVNVDFHVGRQIRIRRVLQGLSQAALAESLGVSFQQIQKYERGANRISAGHLFELARTLSCTPNEFFEGLQIDAGLRGAYTGLGKDELSLCLAFRNLDVRARRAILAFARSLS